MTQRDETMENGDESFAALFEQSIKAKDDFEPGEKVTGKIVGITKDTIFVDISGKSEAVIPAGEFLNPDGTLSVKVKDTITAYIAAVGAAGVQLTSVIGKGTVNPAILRTAQQNKIPVEGTVAAKTNGGFTVQIDGIRAFCPMSQIDRKFSGNDADYIGKSFQFTIIELRGRDVVVSRKELLDQVQKEAESVLKTKLAVGEIRDAVVTRIADFGVFADFGGIEGLIPKHELGRSRLLNPSDFSAGQKVSVKVAAIDWTSRRFSLSIKETEKDPWSEIKIGTGDSLKGTVTNIIKNGAFVELVPGLEGFIPVSKMSYTRRIAKPEDVVAVGDSVTVTVGEIDPKSRRISLVLETGEADPWSTSSDGIQNEIHTATVESSRASGVSARLANGMEGFVPGKELLCGRNDDVERLYPAGKEIRVVVKEINTGNKRIILSEKDVVRREEQKEIQEYMNKEEAAVENSSLGAQYGNLFSDLKKKMEK
ncbi:MAG: S1 RNA-binding domain-containing protein [Spirochaetota bacterium]